ncbi:UNVERIFIED_CONTAM: hypothetical protein C7454_1258 [Acidovorax defluvii]
MQWMGAKGAIGVPEPTAPCSTRIHVPLHWSRVGSPLLHVLDICGRGARPPLGDRGRFPGLRFCRYSRGWCWRYPQRLDRWRLYLRLWWLHALRLCPQTSVEQHVVLVLVVDHGAAVGATQQLAIPTDNPARLLLTSAGCLAFSSCGLLHNVKTGPRSLGQDADVFADLPATAQATCKTRKVSITPQLR